MRPVLFRACVTSLTDSLRDFTLSLFVNIFFVNSFYIFTPKVLISCYTPCYTPCYTINKCCRAKLYSCHTMLRPISTQDNFAADRKVFSRKLFFFRHKINLHLKNVIENFAIENCLR